MKKIIGKDANCSKKKYFQVNRKSTTDSGEIANSFNDFFVPIGSEVAKNIVTTTDPMFYVNPCYISITIPPVTKTEVRQTILSIKKLP